MRNFQGYFSRTFQDLKLQFPGLSRATLIFQDFSGAGILKKKKSRTFQEALEPCKQLHKAPKDFPKANRQNRLVNKTLSTTFNFCSMGQLFCSYSGLGKFMQKVNFWLFPGVQQNNRHKQSPCRLQTCFLKMV